MDRQCVVEKVREEGSEGFGRSNMWKRRPGGPRHGSSPRVGSCNFFQSFSLLMMDCNECPEWETKSAPAKYLTQVSVVFLVISLFVFVFVFAKTPQLVVEWVNWSHFSPMAVNAIERKTACTSKTGERQMLSMPRWITRFANAETHNWQIKRSFSGFCSPRCQMVQVPHIENLFVKNNSWVHAKMSVKEMLGVSHML